MSPKATLLFALSLLLVACSEPVTPTVTPTSIPEATSRPPTPTARITASPVPQRLVLCTREPQAASPFLPSQAGSDLVALFYEQPVERVGYTWHARLVERVPSLEAGDVTTRTARVTAGARYADAVGRVHQYSGSEDMTLPQLVVTFTLKSELSWSDGQPVRAKDSVLGYHLAQTAQAQGRWRELAERTARFYAIEEHTLRWEGIPGFLGTDYPGFIFPLQPAHRWQGQDLASILQDRTPPATGPFRIVAWETGREIRLAPNPHYSGHKPLLEEVVVRFPQQDPNSWPGLLVSDQCDVILPDPIILTDWKQWAKLGRVGEALVWADVAPAMFRLDFNLDPTTSTTSPVQDVRVRDAIALCLNGERLTEVLPTEALEPAEGFIPPNHPTYAPENAAGYDPTAAQRLLDRAGWRDSDRDGVREAYGVRDFENGEPLSITLELAPQYLRVGAHVATDLETCGIRANLNPTSLRELYTPGADSVLFGRRFEMALIGWQAEVPETCGAWLSGRVPDSSTEWYGENFSGFRSDAYDEACKRALSAIDLEEQGEALRRAQQLLQVTRPTAFFTWRPFWFASRPDVKGLVPDASAYGTIWNIEDVSIGELEAVK